MGSDIKKGSPCPGFLAQLGERQPYKLDVTGSSPVETIHNLVRILG